MDAETPFDCLLDLNGEASRVALRWRHVTKEYLTEFSQFCAEAPTHSQCQSMPPGTIAGGREFTLIHSILLLSKYARSSTSCEICRQELIAAIFL
jgi:hypothetical protein